ncbi:MAG TPA: 3-keto-5-aminohexanoate cleavage protein [Firmicutes bacterium]|nr:3-keto-5-aminohexanoate cleavage protein [Bacillota bacterium]
MEKLIITIAPTGNVPTKEKTPHVPVTPKEIAESVYESYMEGAAIAHIHARDEQGKPTYRRDIFKEIVERIREKCDIIIQISTGARAGKTAEERGEALDLGAEMASLTTGSSNFPTQVNSNSPDLIEYLCKRMLEFRVIPEVEVFDAAMIPNAIALAKKGLIPTPMHFNLVLGVPGSLPATPRNLFYLYESLPEDCTWQVSAIGPLHVELSMMAMALGGNIRTGIEDNIYYDKGVLATNPKLVERIVRVARAAGREIATPEEARRILNLR